MLAADIADGAGLAAHDDGVRDLALRTIPDTVEEFAVGDARCAEEDVLAGDKVARREHPVEVMPRIEGLAALIIISRPEAALDDAAHAHHGARGDDALGRAADPDE